MFEDLSKILVVTKRVMVHESLIGCQLGLLEKKKDGICDMGAEDEEMT